MPLLQAALPSASIDREGSYETPLSGDTCLQKKSRHVNTRTCLIPIRRSDAGESSNIAQSNDAAQNGSNDTENHAGNGKAL